VLAMLYARSLKAVDASLFVEMRSVIQRIALKCEGCRISVGETAGRMEEFKQLYMQAKTAREVSPILLPGEEIVFYRDLSIIDLLHENRFDFSEISYLHEQITSFDACTTLEIYLESGNPKRAAERQFIHDNTMRYRVTKLEQCLNMDLSKPLNRINLLLKVKLWRLARKGT